MIVERTEHPSWLSNAYLVADGQGGHGVLIDGNGVTSSLFDRMDEDDVTVTHILLTHHHGDHVVDIAQHAERFGVPVVAHELTARELGDVVTETIADGATICSGDLSIQALATPGHCEDHLAFLVDGTDCFTGDVLFRGTVGGTRGPSGSYEKLHASIMDRLLRLPASTRIHPGHSGSS
ncbi:MAG: MBL fold metallo-hydrolase, partial [Actinobacteria bacterium]|nr:MBL fold metallo-hydrolase [Actinomycetota bacterium]